MNLASPAVVRDLLARLEVRPRRSLGQNFLVDRNILLILVDAADLSPADQVLEVGAGLGLVTEELLGRCSRVVAVETDRRLCEHLRVSLGGHARLDLRCADALELDVSELFRSGVNAVVSNLPYSVGSRVLGDIFMAEPLPERIVVTVQKEVGDRLTAAPGTRDYGLLSVWAQVVYDVRAVKPVSPSCFWPKPEVGSLVLRMTQRPAPLPGAGERSALRDLTRRAFQHRRKQLAVTLGGAGGVYEAACLSSALAAMGVDVKARPEDLAPLQWLALSRAPRRA